MAQNEAMAAASYRATVCRGERKGRDGERGRGKEGRGEGRREGEREREMNKHARQGHINPKQWYHSILRAYSDKSNGEKEIPVDPILRHMLLVISTLNDHQPEYTNG